MTRALAWFTIAAQVAFVAAWIIAGELEDGYSHVYDYVSELGADGAANPGIVNAAIVVLGLALAALGPALWRTLPRRTSSRLAGALFVLTGVCFVVAGIFNGDCSTAVDPTCQARYDDWGTLSTSAQIHGWAAFIAQFLLIATPFALARALWNQPAAAPALAVGIIGIALGVAATFGDSVDHGPDGLVQRAEFLALHTWAIIVAAGVLWATRRPPLPAPTPLRPSEFFATTWVGDGELVPWPPVIWRRFAQRLRVRRVATFLSDEVWHFDDEIRREDGTLLEARRIFCTLAAPDRVDVTSDRLLDGTQIFLEEDGYRVAPYRVAMPVGPVHFGCSVRDSATVEDGTLVNRLKVSWFGLPVARIEVRVRPESKPA